MFVGPLTHVQLVNMDENDAIIDIVTIINFQSKCKYLGILVGIGVEPAWILPLDRTFNSSNT